MAKVALGSAANAQAAWDAVARMRSNGLNRTTSSASQWSNALALDSASSSFAFHGCYVATIGLRNLSDGIVYKVARDGLTSWYATEKSRFDALNAQGKTWLCDYFPYDTQNVMAIRQYSFLDPYCPQIYAARPAGAPADPDVLRNFLKPGLLTTAQLSTAQQAIAAWPNQNDQPCAIQFGLDASNNLFAVDAPS